MTGIGVFLIAMVCSFGGSIPPGSINLSVMQLAMQNKKAGALTFAIAAAMVEFVYAGVAVHFQIYLTEHVEVASWFKWISGGVLILLGVLNLVKKVKQVERKEIGEKRAGFLKGMLVALANPLAIPFWLAVTAYLQSMNWVRLSADNYLLYVGGVSTGTILLLVSVIYLGSRFSSIQDNVFVLYRLPGIIFVFMGLWTFIQ